MMLPRPTIVQPLEPADEGVGVGRDIEGKASDGGPLRLHEIPFETAQREFVFQRPKVAVVHGLAETGGETQPIEVHELVMQLIGAATETGSEVWC
ncbi:MAG: hypothetical protein NVS3B20_26150 [Polyangiales bacterium]